MQKRRELRAAGIQARKKRKKKRGVDYNAEIPFERKPASGFHDTTEEDSQKMEVNFAKLRQQHLDGMRWREKEEALRKKDKQKKQDKALPALLNKPQEPVKKRSKLVLPAPQISDAELQDVVKLGQASAAAKTSVEDGSSASDALLQDYNLTPNVNSLRTARTPMLATDSVMQEAQNIMALHNVETPLKGGLNTELTETDFSGVTPQKQEMQTPNMVIATPFRTPVNKDGLATPGLATPGSIASSSGVPGATPIRDKLNINQEGYDEAMTPYNQVADKINLKSALANLPAPKNDFEIVLPEDEEMEAEDAGHEKENGFVEDAEDIDMRRQEKLNAEKEAELAKRHLPVQRELPRPTLINETILRTLTPKTLESMSDLQKAEEIIKKEMITMLHFDALNHPSLNQIPGKTKKAVNVQQHVQYLQKNQYEDFSKEQLEVS